MSEGNVEMTYRVYVLKLFAESMTSILIRTEFKHIWFTDQLTSMIGPLRDMEYTLCYYVHYSSKSLLNQHRLKKRRKYVMEAGSLFF